MCERDCLKDFASLSEKMPVEEPSLLENFRLTVKGYINTSGGNTFVHVLH